jgi:hypothetical protein
MGIDRELSIVAQVAAKEAGAISRSIIETGGTWDENAFTLMTAHIYDVIVELANGSSAPAAATVAQPEAAVVQAFPGAQVVQPAAAPAGNGFLATNGINPNGLSTAKDDKGIEFQLVQDLDSTGTNGWYDNRVGKKNPKGPDFKRKSDGKALWLRAA